MIIMAIVKRSKTKNGITINHVKLFENYIVFSNKELKRIKSDCTLKVHGEKISIYPVNLNYFKKDVEKRYGQTVRVLNII